MKIAIYPGSFDPIHEGHLKIVLKASELFDKLFVVVSNNAEKKAQTDMEDRFSKAKEAIKITNVEVIKNEDKLTVVLAKELNANWIVRSGRKDDDFQYELELAAANNHLNSNIETIMILPDLDSVDYESRLIKQGVK